MKYELNQYHRNTPPEELLSDVRKVATKLKKKSVSISDYTRYGKYHGDTLINRFGSWNKALEKANLEIGLTQNITTVDLLKNIETVWISLGRQPKFSEMKKPLSKYSVKPYVKNFGGWRNALESFINYINQENEDDKENNIDISVAYDKKLKAIKKRSQRNITERLRFRILLRDGFTCRKCGRSPLNSHGVELHVDHIIPWSKGGETEPDNLETKCNKCNLGKGNAFNV